MLSPEYFNIESKKPTKPYFKKPQALVKQKNRIAIIGAGMAGCAAAHKLAETGFQIHLYDKNNGIAEGASGNVAGMLKPYLTADANASDLFHTRGYFETIQFLHDHINNKILFKETGALQILSCEKVQDRYQRIFTKRELPEALAKKVTAKEGSELSGIDIQHDGIFYPKACLVSPKEFCRVLLESIEGNVTLHLNHEVNKLSQTENNLWRINDGECAYDAVVVCGGAEAIKGLSQTKEIPVYAAEGQVSHIHLDENIKCILSDKGYLMPEFNGQQTLGATYRESNDSSGELRDQDHQDNLTHLNEILGHKNCELLGGRVAARCVTSDHMPIVGAVPDYVQFLECYQSDFKKGTVLSRLKDCPYPQGLYISSGFGSKGLCSALLSAQIITSLVEGNMLPVSDKVYQALHPARFWAKGLKTKN
ncbi:FAD-dependent 5-carboxymethylaminomethyl-2-thiouridine(34) oxidoreductase MnmC [Francisellaceae bacterium]|nr:FAD-dependent 5-carboxymethylaminomethyl-2-thiouridine(34) oxidoreductase MnmC [Francisellaceae bacterium]